jgi:hypothetical protein
MNLFGHLVWPLGQGISPMQGLYLHKTTQHRKTWTHNHALSGIQTYDPSVWAVKDSTCLRPHGHWDQLYKEANCIVLNRSITCCRHYSSPIWEMHQVHYTVHVCVINRFCKISVCVLGAHLISLQHYTMHIGVLKYCTCFCLFWIILRMNA